MKKIVCIIDRKMCMVHQCESFPGKGLDTFLKNEIEMDDEDELYIEQWQTTDRSTLITQTVI